MNTEQLPSLEQLHSIALGEETKILQFKCNNSDEAYRFIEQVLVEYSYHTKLKKIEKGWVVNPSFLKH